MKEKPTVAAKQRWRNLGTGQEARVMAVADGYVMARYKGALPWIRYWKDFELNFERREP